MNITASLPPTSIPIFLILCEGRLVGLSRNQTVNRAKETRVQIPDPLGVYNGTEYVWMGFRSLSFSSSSCSDDKNSDNDDNSNEILEEDFHPEFCEETQYVMIMKAMQKRNHSPMYESVYPPLDRIYVNNATNLAVWIIADARETSLFYNAKMQMFCLSENGVAKDVYFHFGEPICIIGNFWSLKHKIQHRQNRFLEESNSGYDSDEECRHRIPTLLLTKEQVPWSISQSTMEKIEYSRGYKYHLERMRKIWTELIQTELLHSIFPQDLIRIIEGYVLETKSDMWANNPRMRSILSLDANSYAYSSQREESIWNIIKCISSSILISLGFGFCLLIVGNMTF